MLWLYRHHSRPVAWVTDYEQLLDPRDEQVSFEGSVEQAQSLLEAEGRAVIVDLMD